MVELPLPRAMAAPLCDVAAAAREHLDAIVVDVRDVDVATCINRDTPGVDELPGLAAMAAPLCAVGGR